MSKGFTAVRPIWALCLVFLYLSIGQTVELDSTCLRDILKQRDVKVENEGQIACLNQNEGFNEAQKDLCDQNAPSTEYIAYLEHKAKYDELTEQLKNDPENKLLRSQRQSALLRWQSRGFKIKIERGLLKLMAPIVGECHISKFGQK